MINEALNHLWQSTVFAAFAGLLTLALRTNHARARHWIWMIASMKFLIPFSLLVGIGSHLGWSSAPAKEPGGLSYLMDEISQPFTPRLAVGVASETPPPSASVLPYLVVAVWFCGCATVLLFWWVRWRRIRAVVRAAVRLTEGRELEALRRVDLGGTGFSRCCCAVMPVIGTKAQAKACATIEPGIFGIFRPILLLPSGIADRLDDGQLEALIAHELCHVRRRDNLAAAIHMLVEAVFWFHPLVWWLGARLVTERERACDEEVLRLGSEPQVYAEGILKVCRYYLESPLVCVSGITGANLKRRIEGIMMNRTPNKLSFARRTLLATLGAAAVVGPIAIGLLYAPPSRAQSPDGSASKLTFEAATIKRSQPGKQDRRMVTYDPGQVTFSRVSLEALIQEAYSVKTYQITGPDCIQSSNMDIVAKAAGAAPESQLKLMLQTFLADRFKLAMHREKKELPVYALTVGKNGPKFSSAADGSKRMVAIGEGGFHLNGYSMQNLADFLSRMPSLGRPVLDMTGLSGSFDLTLKMSELDPGAAPDEMKRSLRDWNSIFTDVQNSLGLKLESRKSEIEILVIDHAEKVPTEN
jgi:bla regulator protein BlaR1